MNARSLVISERINLLCCTAVSYIRVSKPKQGRSGLGLEAQQAAIRLFCAQHGYKIEAEYREVETGKGADALERRPNSRQP